MIALDAMGGDHAPQVTVQGAINAARKGVPVTLFGNENLLIPLLDAYYARWRDVSISIVHCTQQINMDEEPSRSVVKKYDASLVRAVQAVADGDAHAMVTAGNSGAALVAGTLLIGRVAGLRRPALGNFLPTPQGALFCMDLGANTDCKAEFLQQFALMGHVYVQMMLGINQPRVALLANGAEPYKGSLLVKQAYALLEHNPLINFVGNLEARDIFDGRADVLVCDGFTGNIMLKTAQGTVKAVSTWLKQEAAFSWWNTLKLACSASLFKKLKQKTDYTAQGGALLLGLNKPVIVAHGCSTAAGIEQALLYTHMTVQDQVVPRFNEQVCRMLGMPSVASVQASQSLNPD